MPTPAIRPRRFRPVVHRPAGPTFLSRRGPPTVDGRRSPHHNVSNAMQRTRALDGLTEAELVTGLRATGDGRCFEELYRRSRRKVFGVCFKILGEASAAEDACHDAYVRAYDRFDSLRGVRFTAWVRRIAANRCYDELRRRRPEVLTDTPPEEPRVDHVERSIISRQDLDRALAIVDSLEPQQRSVFLLRHLDRKSYSEIGEVTGFSAKQVKSYLQNARRNFQLAWRRAEGPTGGVDHG